MTTLSKLLIRLTGSILVIPVLCVSLVSCKTTTLEDKQFETVISEKTWTVGMNDRYLQLSSDGEKDVPELMAEMLPAEVEWETAVMSGKTITGSRYSVAKKGSNVVVGKDGDPLATLTESEGKLIITVKNCPHMYGVGQRVGGMDLLNLPRGFTLKNQHFYGKQAVMPIPVIYSDDGLVIYFAMPSQPKLTFERKGRDAVVTLSPRNNGINLIIMKEKDLVSASKAYIGLHGLPPLLPKWMFGYIQSKYGYKSSAEVRAVADRFKKEGLPWTGIILDLYWFKQMGDISWDTSSFGDYKKLIRELRDDGIRMINISEPFFTTESRNYERFDKAGYFARSKNGGTEVMDRWWGTGAIFDYTNPEAADVLWNDVYKPLVKDGIEGFWTDLGEPEQVPFTSKFFLGTEIEIHNLYNYYWSKLIYDNFRKDFPDKRLVILSRSGWAPSARFGQGNWSGDASSKWDGLSLQPVQMVNSALSGFSYWASDVGGFVGKGTPSLFVRWNEFGLFSPVYRPHGSHVDREPWAFESSSPESLQQVSGLLEQRARLLPYIYSTARRVSTEGMPFVTPVSGLPSSLPDKEYNELHNQSYWFGTEILVRTAGSAKSCDVPLVEDGTWLEMQTKTRYKGGKIHKVEYPAGTPPYFLKPNGILVTNRDASYSEPERVQIYINSSSTGRGDFSYYNDDGVSNSYLEGEFNQLDISVENSGSAVTVRCDPVVTGYTDVTLPEIEIILYIPSSVETVNYEKGKLEIDTGKQVIKEVVQYPEDTPYTMSISW
jgi:alpha-glucosidase (family GH31 glycosyl hydrolase)